MLAHMIQVASFRAITGNNAIDNVWWMTRVKYCHCSIILLTQKIIYNCMVVRLWTSFTTQMKYFVWNSHKWLLILNLTTVKVSQCVHLVIGLRISPWLYFNIKYPILKKIWLLFDPRPHGVVLDLQVPGHDNGIANTVKPWHARQQCKFELIWFENGYSFTTYSETNNYEHITPHSQMKDE